MRLYEYLIGGKKTGQINDLKDPMPDSKPFCELKTGETFFASQFKPDGTLVYADEIEISSIAKEHTYWAFTGFGKKGTKYEHSMLTEDLGKKLEAWDQRVYYMVLSTFKMDDEPLFELAKKEIENSKK